MNPDDHVDDLGGIVILLSEEHKCLLPPAEDHAKTLAYRTVCCRVWMQLRQDCDEAWPHWETIGWWRLRRLKRKGLIPND